LPESIAAEEIEKNAGTQFDPEIVRVFINKVINKKVKTSVDIDVT